MPVGISFGEDGLRGFGVMGVDFLLGEGISITVRRRRFKILAPPCEYGFAFYSDFFIAGGVAVSAMVTSIKSSYIEPG